jgi:flagellar hook-basal body complex protein FliE
MPSISPISLLPGAASVAGALRPKTVAFESVLGDAIKKVEDFQTQATQSVERFLSGESEDLHRTVMDTQRAELSFELFSQARNKVVQAYQEIMRMQL